MILPLLVEHVQHDQRQQPVPESASHDSSVTESNPSSLLLETTWYRIPSPNSCADFHRCTGFDIIGEFRYLQHEVHQQVLLNVFEIPLFLTIERRECLLNTTLHATFNHLQRFGLELFAPFQCANARSE